MRKSGIFDPRSVGYNSFCNSLGREKPSSLTQLALPISKLHLLSETAGVFVMGNVTERKGRLCFDFSYRKKRCREQTLLNDTPSNRKKLAQVLRKIEAEITLGTFDYARYFPNSPRVEEFEKFNREMRLRSGKGTQLFKEFIPTWYEEMKIGWRDSYDQTVVKILNGRLLKIFGEKEVSEITKADLLQFRARLGEEAGRNGKKMSPSHINRHMYLMRMILREAADRFDFNTPFKGIKALRKIHSSRKCNSFNFPEHLIRCSES
jgi:integrase